MGRSAPRGAASNPEVPVNPLFGNSQKLQTKKSIREQKVLANTAKKNCIRNVVFSLPQKKTKTPNRDRMQRRLFSVLVSFCVAGQKLVLRLVLFPKKTKRKKTTAMTKRGKTKKGKHKDHIVTTGPVVQRKASSAAGPPWGPGFGLEE